MARNRHVLPAPISLSPRRWLCSDSGEPDPGSLLCFNHIRDLRLQNVWFSPLMLEEFMIQSQDTSLRTLTLDSVSLTATHSQQPTAAVTTASECSGPMYPPSMWLQESLPTNACWPAVIDRITPGPTFLDRKHQAGLMGDAPRDALASTGFRGFVSRLVFESCGYVRISGLASREFNQSNLIFPNSDPMDAGLKARAAALAEKGVMLSEQKPCSGSDWPLLGQLTQCLHPVEKRVLEQAWGMTFGWGDDLRRWGAVEDGCFEGGTGRFNGVIQASEGH